MIPGFARERVNERVAGAYFCALTLCLYHLFIPAGAGSISWLMLVFMLALVLMLVLLLLLLLLLLLRKIVFF